jgi:hypothetical protein
MEFSETSSKMVLEIRVTHMGITVLSFDEYEMPEFEFTSQGYHI